MNALREEGHPQRQRARAGRERRVGRQAVLGAASPAMRCICAGITAYFGLLFVLDAYQAWMKAIPLGQALHDSVPLAAITCFALGFLTAVAWLRRPVALTRSPTIE